MDRTELVLVNDLCTHYHISHTFITGLQDAGLLEIVIVEQTEYLHGDSLRDLEKLVRFHSEMDINLEGIEAIVHLLHQVDELQNEIGNLKKRLKLYE